MVKNQLDLILPKKSNVSPASQVNNKLTEGESFVHDKSAQSCDRSSALLWLLVVSDAAIRAVTRFDRPKCCFREQHFLQAFCGPRVVDHYSMYLLLLHFQETLLPTQDAIEIGGLLCTDTKGSLAVVAVIPSMWLRGPRWSLNHCSRHDWSWSCLSTDWPGPNWPYKESLPFLLLVRLMCACMGYLEPRRS